MVAVIAGGWAPSSFYAARCVSDEPYHWEPYHWDAATPSEYQSMLRRHGCTAVPVAGAARRPPDRHQCCSTADRHPETGYRRNPRVSRAGVTAVRRLVLRPGNGTGEHRTSLPPVLRVLHDSLSGGVFTLVGDSVTAQAFHSLVSRARVSKSWRVVMARIPTSNLTAASVSVIKKSGGHYGFTLELFRCDRASDFPAMVKAALKVAPVRYPKSSHNAKLPMPSPRHIVSINIGLHFTGKKSTTFARDLTILARRMQLINLLSNHFTFFRDVTPQHFKPRTGAVHVANTGQFEKRDLAASTCAPITAKNHDAAVPSVAQGERNRSSVAHLNSILYSVAATIGVPVQATHALLTERHDAHIEARKSTSDKFILDCTHWCADVLDVFDVTLADILSRRYGGTTPCAK